QYGFTDAIDQSGKLDAKQWGAVDKGGPHCSYTSYLHANGQFDTYADDYQRRAQEATHFAAAWPSPLAREHYTDDFCGRTALELLDRQPNEGPWMLWVNFPGPHDPFDPPRELQARYDGVAFPEPVAGKAEHLRKDGSAVPLNHQQIRRNYAAACEGIDEWVGRIMDKVAQRGELENTVVVFSSDHGEMLGDHGRFLKNVPQEGSVHVPLIIAGPGIQKGAVSDALVELIDISATLLEAAGLECPGDWDALPLGSVLRGEAADGDHREVQVSALGAWRMICDGRYKCILHEDGEPELYDMQEDPGELTNLAGDQPQRLQLLEAALAAQTGDENPCHARL
ncbi:MAG: sulfatase-like hydrolase/transferase, partial [Phycisphaeraceae bacterium]